MGRYVTGDFEWKFAVCKQYSSFGEILADICKDIDNVGVKRYICDDEGEIVKLYVDDIDAFEQACLKYLDGFIDTELNKLNMDNQEYWDKCMIQEFINTVDFEDKEEYVFEVEY
jgi:hypothetical protein